MRLAKKLFIGLAAVSLFAAVAAFTPAKENAGEWFFLGDKNVGFGVDHDVIKFGNWKDDVRQIKLRVTDGPLKMYDMKIHFDNGDVQDVQLRSKFVAGSDSRVIDLNGGLRHLSKVEFTYETKGFLRGRARVAVWGRN
jgi:hypothetical protein